RFDVWRNGHIHVSGLCVAAALVAPLLWAGLWAVTDLASVISPVCALVLAPLLLGLINRTKAFVAGRRGPPLLQPYFDIAKCLRRSAVYGDTTSWVFRLGPVVNLAVLLAGLLIVPLGGISPPLSFSGDLVVL